MNEWHDRAVDTALHELHGRRPPDLTARVLLALREEPAGALPQLRRRRGPVAYLLAAAMLTAALLLWSWHGGDATATPQPLAEVEVAVAEGTLVCTEAGAATTVASGQQHAFPARAGNRLRAPLAARARLGQFGTIDTVPQTELEVRSMEFTLRNGAVAASAMTLSVVAGVVTWHSLTRGETANAGQLVRMEAPTEESKQLAAENERLRAQLDDLHKQIADLRATREAVPPIETPLEEPPPPPVELAPATAAVAFGDPAYDAALAKVDWKLMGDVSKQMQPLLRDLVQKLLETGEVSTEDALKLQELNPKLAAVIPALLEAKLPGTGPNGAYTHPLVVANTLASTLAAAGVPLDASQSAALQGLVRAFGAECAAVDAQQSEFAVEKLLAEIEVKDRFFQEMGTRLTPEQFASIYPDGTRDYDGANLFSTGVMTRPFTEGIPARDANEFARQASTRLSQDLELDEATTQKVRDIVASVSAKAPELWNDKANAAETRLRMVRSGRTTAALRQQIAIMREIQRTVPLTPEQRKRFSQLRGILVPLPR